jgi:hypothetical protein
MLLIVAGGDPKTHKPKNPTTHKPKNPTTTRPGEIKKYEKGLGENSLAGIM